MYIIVCSIQLIWQILEYMERSIAGSSATYHVYNAVALYIVTTRLVSAHTRKEPGGSGIVPGTAH